MTLSEIWSTFASKVKENASSCWKSIKDASKATFEIFKIALIDFVGAVFKWLWEVVYAAGVLVLELIKTVFQFAGAAVQSTLGLAYDKVIAWITKW